MDAHSWILIASLGFASDAVVVLCGNHQRELVSFTKMAGTSPPFISMNLRNYLAGTAFFIEISNFFAAQASTLNFFFSSFFALL